MDNKQKRTLLSLLYRTMLIISILCLFVTIFLCSQRIYKNVDSVMWLDITLICLSCVLFILCISDIVTTKKLDGKYALAKFYYTVIFRFRETVKWYGIMVRFPKLLFFYFFIFFFCKLAENILKIKIECSTLLTKS